jgi:predicted NBD/HSP70 family sugar kinase
MENNKYKSINKEIRKKDILRLICKSGSISREDITAQTMINTPAVYNIVADLLRNNFIIESGYTDSTGGRRSSLLSLNPAFGYLVGVSIEQEFVNVVLSDFSSKPIAQKKAEFLRYNGNVIRTAEIINTVIKSIVNLIADYDKTKIFGVCIGIPGIINKERTIGVFNPHVPDWINVDIKQQVESAVSLPVFIENKNNLAALSESFDNNGYKNLVYFHVDTGVAIGIIIDNEIYIGSTGSAGEFGHTVVSTDGRPCVCGNKGCLESYVSIQSIMSQVKESITHGVYTSLPQQYTFTDIVTGYKTGDKLVLTTVNNVSRYLSIGIVNMINTLNPGMIVLGGRITEFGDPLLNLIIQRVTGLSWHGNKDNQPVICFSKSEINNQSIGAVRYITEKIISKGEIV